MTGCYRPYPVCVQLLQKHKFCTLDQFQSFINDYENMDDLHFSIIRRAAVKEKFLSLRTGAPFSKTFRFPDSFYIDMDCAQIRTVTKEFLNALLLLDLWEQHSIHANRIQYINNVIDANFAFTKFADIIMSTDIEHLEENGIYCRQTFEKKYQCIRWYPQGSN